MPKLFLFFLFLCLGWSGALAGLAREVVVFHNGEVDVQIEPRSSTRITVVNDRIVSVVKAHGQYELDHQPETGDVFIKPSATTRVGWRLRLFLTTEKQRTYSLNLYLSRQVRGNQIILREHQPDPPPAPESLGIEREALPQETFLLQEDMVILLRAMVNRVLPEGYVFEKPDRAFELPEPYEAEADFAFYNDRLRGDKLTVRVGSKVTDIPPLSEPMFLRPGVVAVWISQPVSLNQREVAVYIFRRTPAP